MEDPQIRAIRRYLAKYEIKHIDVRAELLDHFASAVTDIQKSQPNLSFKEALMVAHRRFGGKKAFTKYLNTAKEKVNKKVAKTIGSIALSFLGWPGVLVLLFALVAAFVVVRFLPLEAVYFSLLLLFIGQALYLYFEWKNTDYYLVKRSISNYGWYVYFLVFLPLNNLLLFNSTNRPVSSTLAIGVVAIGVFLLVVIAKTPRKLSEKAAEQYDLAD